MNRAKAARGGGMDRHMLRDWVHRLNAHGRDGLKDVGRSASGAGATRRDLPGPGGQEYRRRGERSFVRVPRSQLSASEQVDLVEGEAEALIGGLVIIGRGQTFELGVARVRQAARF